MPTKLIFIVAMAKNRAMGLGGRLPWGHLPEDTARVNSLLAKHKAIMGRKSYDTPDRLASPLGNIVLTTQKNYSVEEGFEVASSLTEALSNYTNEEVVVILGGATVFSDAFAMASEIWLTEIDGDFEGDTFFPDFDLSGFHLTEKEVHPPDEKHNVGFTFLTYQRITF